ncbi:MAG: archaeosortase/exosortase family protein [Nitrospirota bacterium]
METHITYNTKNINWKFLALFTLYLGIFIGLVQIPQSLYHEAERFTASAVAYFWKLFFIPVTSVDTHVTFFDFKMEIILECTGVHYAAIFVAAIFAFQGHTFSYKTAGLFIGIVAIFLLNLFRLGIIGMIGHFYPSLFTFVHLYLWQALFTLFVLMLWIMWVNGKVSFPWLRAKQILLAAAVASISFWLMITYINYYLSFIAYIADSIFPLFAVFMPIPTSVIAEGELIGYVSGVYVIYSETGLYALNYAIFFSLAPLAALSSGRKVFVKKFMAGTGFMTVSHLCLILMDWSLEVTADATSSSVLRWCIVLSSMIAPVVSWLCATLLFSPKTRKAM